MDMRAVVGLNVQRLRRERGISQEELSLASSCTRGYLSGIETGRRNPTVMFLAGLAAVLNVEISEFFVKPIARRPTSKNSRAKVDRPTKFSARQPKKTPIRQS